MLLRRRNGLCDWKKLPFFFCACASSAPEDRPDRPEPLYCLVGECWPLVGSKLESEVGAE